MPAISVVINTYNSAKFICETIQSVLDQSWTDFELIIIDDGSKDNTLEVVKTIQDDRILIYPYTNGGISKSRNRGIERASGEFIAFLDHDDLWHQQKLEQQLQALQAAPQAAMAYSWIDMINESGQPIRRIHPTHSDKPLYPQLLARNFLMTASNPLMRRSSLVAIGGFDESIYGADDWDVFIRLAERSDLALSPHYHIQYRVVEGSGSANVAKIEQGCLQVIEKAFRSAPAKFKPIQKVALGKVYQFLCFRTLEEMAGRHSGFAAWRYLSLSRQNQPSLWDTANVAKVLFKIGAAIALPQAWAKPVVAWTVKRFR